MLALYIYNRDHELVSSYRKFSTPKHNYPKDIYDEGGAYNADKVREYAESTENDMLVSGYYNTGLNRTIVRFAIKLHKTNHPDEEIGYVVCDADSKVVRRIMEKYNISYNTFTWLQPHGDIPICVIDFGDAEDMQTFEEISTSIKDTGNASPKQEYGENVLFQVEQSRYPLTAYALTAQSILKENQRLLTQNLVLIAVILTGLLSLLILYVTKTLTRPLEELSATVKQIGAGETELRIRYTEQDEIGQLGTEFNHMLDEMERLIGKQYESELLRHKAEYKALQAQINPHFLYNTLDTMSSIASIQDCEIVSGLCQSLSNLFRYSLDMSHPYATVASEVNHLKNYIFVMNVRMRDEIQYRFDIADEVLQDSLPRISIQPLVENAINHGLRNKHGKKEICISAEAQDGRLSIIVEDNGVGLDEDEISRRLKEHDNTLAEAGESIGIYNINARMKMLYGEEYGMEVYSRKGEGTSVRIRIPEKKLDELI